VIGHLLVWGYAVGYLVTLIKLTFLDCYPYTWWNWIFVLPINVAEATIWPVYWWLLRPLLWGGCPY
jgi:hypothetical protein